MPKALTKKYTNGEVTVVWKPAACIHSTICFRGLPQVFDPRRRPWVDIAAADTDRIVAQVEQCPSGALSSYRNAEKGDGATVESEAIVEATANGPLLVYGNVQVKASDGSVTKRHKVTAFCRCGASSNKPYCDGTHAKVGFRG